MRYHDFHLKDYTVSNHGVIVTLCLIKTEGSAPEAKQKVESHIEFSDVETYNFIHSGGAILTDILEVSLEQMINEVYPKLAEWSIQIGPLPGTGKRLRPSTSVRCRSEAAAPGGFTRP